MTFEKGAKAIQQRIFFSDKWYGTNGNPQGKKSESITDLIQLTKINTK